MGLDAYVPCRCWRDGLATPPPVDPSLVRVTEWGDVRPDTEDRALRDQLYIWQRTACQHPYMDVVSERIGNWASVRGFRQAVSTAGEFPTLRDLLPDFNGGLVTVEESAAALAELARFIALDSVGADAFLVDLDTGRELWSTPGDVYWSTPYTIGYDANGLYVVNRGGRSPVEVFRAMRVGQLPVPDGTGAPVGWTQLTDLDDGTLIVVRALPLRGPEPPRRMGVVTREVTPGDYAYLTEPLTAVLRVSVATGNAVFWE